MARFIESHWNDVFSKFDSFDAVASYDGYGSYQGWGAAVMHRDDDGYYTADYSHCSCYGPDEGMDGPNGPFATYADAIRRFGESYRETIPATEPDWDDLDFWHQEGDR